MYDILLLLVLVGGLSYFLYYNIRHSYFITDNWLYIAYIVLIAYHVLKFIDWGSDYSQYHLGMTGFLYLNYFFTNAVSGNSYKLFNKINTFFVHLAIYIWSITLLVSLGMQINFFENERMLLIFNMILTGIVLVDLLYLFIIKCDKHFKYFGFCLKSLMLNCLLSFSFFPQLGTFNEIANLITASLLYIFTTLSFKRINNYKREYLLMGGIND